MDKNGLQKSIDQIGLDSVQRYLPKGMKVHSCELHGSFLTHYTSTSPLCPLCIHDTEQVQSANGVTASQIEHYINLGNPGIAEAIATQEIQRIAEKEHNSIPRVPTQLI